MVRFFYNIGYDSSKFMSQSSVVALLARLAMASFVICLSLIALPHYQQLQYTTARSNTLPAPRMPVMVNAAHQELTVSGIITLTPLHPVLWQLIADNCVDSFWVNGQNILKQQEPICNYHRGVVLDLSEYLQPGNNTFKANVLNKGGPAGISLTPSFVDFWVLLLIAVLTLWLIAELALFLKKRRVHHVIIVLIALGIIFRVIYGSVTPYNIRENDSDGHLAYLNYVIEERSVPFYNKGWQFYHPPLYYATSAVGYGVSKIFGMQLKPGTIAIIWSVILGIGTQLAGVWMILMTKLTRREKTLAVGLISVFPMLIFQSGQINNDSLLTFFMVLGSAFCVRWWNKPRLQEWLIIAVIISLGILTKSNAIVLAVIAIALMFLKFSDWERRLTYLSILGSIVLLIASWHPIQKFVFEGQTNIVGNINSLHSGLSIDKSTRMLTQFNPIDLVQHPYFEPNSTHPRRAYILENMVRSTWFKAFHFPKQFTLVQLIMTLALFLLPWQLYNIIHDSIKDVRSSLPFVILVIYGLSIHIITFWLYSNTTIENMRYSTIVMVPMIYFAVRSHHKKTGWHYAHIVSLLLMFACFLFFIDFFATELAEYAPLVSTN
jgi:hypothetical protein